MNDIFLFKTPQNSKKQSKLIEKDSFSIEEKKEENISFSVENDGFFQNNQNDDLLENSSSWNKENIPVFQYTPIKISQNNNSNSKRIPLMDITPVRKQNKILKSSKRVIIIKFKFIH